MKSSRLVIGCCPDIYVDIIALPAAACIASLRSPVLTCGTPAAERAPHASHSLLPPTYRPRLAWRFMAPYRWRMLRGPGGVADHRGDHPVPGPGHPPAVDHRVPHRLAQLLNRYILLFFVLVLGLAVGTFVRFYLVSWIGERFVADIPSACSTT